MTGSRCTISSATTRKHNEANGENNNDGESHNLSMNFGVEGETADPAIVEARARQVRSFLATLFLSQGVPMMLAGDEMGRTQGGNNNAYCQDNEHELGVVESDTRAAISARFRPYAHRPSACASRSCGGGISSKGAGWWPGARRTSPGSIRTARR